MPQHFHFADEEPGLPVSRAMVRPALAAGLAFMSTSEGPSFHVRDLASWIDRWLVSPGYMPRPFTVHEPGVGSVSLTEPEEAWTEAIAARTARIVEAARERVAATLHGLVSMPADDRFLAANLFAGRVQRAASVERGPHWQPRLQGDERLSDVVIALFTADILAHREEYERRLRVCNDCGDTTFGATSEGVGKLCPHLG